MMTQVDVLAPPTHAPNRSPCLGGGGGRDLQHPARCWSGNLAFKCCWSRRAVEPFAGYWSLPGGKLWGDEALDEAAWRQLAEKTALRASYLEQLYTFELCDEARQLEAAVVAYYALVRTDDTEIAPGSQDDGGRLVSGRRVADRHGVRQ